MSQNKIFIMIYMGWKRRAITTLPSVLPRGAWLAFYEKIRLCSHFFKLRGEDGEEQKEMQLIEHMICVKRWKMNITV